MKKLKLFGIHFNGRGFQHKKHTHRYSMYMQSKDGSWIDRNIASSRDEQKLNRRDEDTSAR